MLVTTTVANMCNLYCVELRANNAQWQEKVVQAVAQSIADDVSPSDKVS